MKNKVMGISFLVAIVLSVFICCASFVFGKGDSKVVIYSNADEEALTAIEHALDESGYQGQYILQSGICFPCISFFYQKVTCP